MTDLAKERVIPAPAGRLWIFMAVLTISAVFGLELFWRHQEFTPSVVDDPALWSLHRRKVEPNSVVLLGTSRMLMNISTETCRAAFPDRRVVQLAANGHSPLEVIEDLSHDPSFQGLIICDAPEWSFLRSFRDGQPPYDGMGNRLEAARNPNLNQDLNRCIATVLQHRFVFIHPNLKLTAILTNLLRWKHGPRPNFVRVLPDRSELGDFTKTSLARYSTPGRPIGLKEEDQTPADAWLEQAMDVEPWVEALHAKGGRVVFVRMPTQNWLWEIGEQMYPKNQYWDRFADSTTAQTVHFKDVSELSKFDCPDNSHLDMRDAPAFTRNLISIIREN